MRKLEFLGKGGFAAVFKVSYEGHILALKQVSKTANYKSSSDVNAAKNEIKVHNSIISSYDSVKASCKNPKVIEYGYDNICKLLYNNSDNKDIWLGFELGGHTLNKLCFNIKGSFNGGARI
eukprot:CAMPEP_0116898470 /NCGR_PEP_ID=MMETSP0467-20121206/7195_1 /TAXON_ID=283647 /ORGANISM="Mesodinium pulex, Strain SPMC105" /LENGTH=120 /DNA_ID=CAMNT_0004570635 /DNA_START=247 /DNA_END=609 /DNA_ORIENTATION=-